MDHAESKNGKPCHPELELSEVCGNLLQEKVGIILWQQTRRDAAEHD